MHMIFTRMIHFFTLYILNTSDPLVIVNVIVSPLPESSDTKIDFMMAVVLAGHVYNVVILVLVRSTLEFL